MKLARKLSLALFLGVVAVLAGYGWLTFQRAVSLYDADVRGDHRRMGGLVRTALAETFKREGEERLLEIVRLTDMERERVEVRFIWLDAPQGSERGPFVPAAELTPLRKRELVQLERDVPALGKGSFLLSYIPVLNVDGRVGALELGESLAPKAAYRRDTVIGTLIASLAIALVCGIVAMGIGRWFVGRPVNELIGKARRVGAGDLSTPLDLPRTDELGLLAREFDAMCDQLAVARERVQSETAAKIRALEQVRHADRLSMIGKLTSVIAHEIGTPLNVVLGHSRLLARKHADLPTVAESTSVINEQCARMTSIVRQVLDYGRRGEPRKTKAELSDLVRSTIDLVRPLAEKHGVTLEIPDPPPGTTADLDATRIQQALTNLIVNAVQASPSGQPVRILLESGSPGAEGDAAYHRISVQDSGPGISPDVLGQMFEPFFTTKDVGQGTGLGLPIARDIVEEHGGRLEVSSELGSGSRFDVLLPAVE